MHDEPRIALFLRRILAIVVNAMTVERERRIPEQARRIEQPLAPPDRIIWRLRRGRCSTRRRLPIHDVLLLAYGDARASSYLVLDRHETQRPGLAALLFDGRDARNTRRYFAQLQRCEELEPATRPHTAWQLHRRHESAASRMSVGAEFSGPGGVEEVDPLPTRRQRRTLLRNRVCRIERRMQRLSPPRIEPTAQLSRTADPILQIRHSSAPNSARIPCECSPTSGMAPYTGQSDARIGCAGMRTGP